MVMSGVGHSSGAFLLQKPHSMSENCYICEYLNKQNDYG